MHSPSIHNGSSHLIPWLLLYYDIVFSSHFWSPSLISSTVFNVNSWIQYQGQLHLPGQPTLTLWLPGPAPLRSTSPDSVQPWVPPLAWSSPEAVWTQGRHPDRHRVEFSRMNTTPCYENKLRPTTFNNDSCHIPKLLLLPICLKSTLNIGRQKQIQWKDFLCDNIACKLIVLVIKINKILQLFWLIKEQFQ